MANLKAVVTLYAANGNLYATTFDSGTTAGTNVLGSVFSVSSEGAMTRLGAQFPTGHLPYCLLWAYGKLWCGTGVNTLNGATAGRIYWIRPGVDTAWTLDKTFAANESIVSGLASFKGLIFASLLWSSTGAGTGKVVVRSLTGTYSNSDTGTINVDGTGVARGYYSLLTWPPEYGANQAVTPALYATRKGISGESGYVIRKFDGSSWSTVYSAGNGGPDLINTYSVNASTNAIVPILWVTNADTSLLNSADGTTFTERIAQVTIDAGMLASLPVQR